MRHEDYPCCGCGPEGCVDTSTTVECGDCGKVYHPDQWTQMYCYACQGSDGLGSSEDWVDDYDGDPGPDYDEFDHHDEVSDFSYDEY